MKKILCRVTAAVLTLFLLYGCTGRSVVTQTKPLEPISESSSALSYPDEFPPALEALPTDPPAEPHGEGASSEAGAVSSSEAGAVSSSEAGAVSSSEAGAVSSSEAAPSSVAASSQPSSEAPPQSTPSTTASSTSDGAFVITPQQPSEQSSSAPVRAPSEAADPGRYDELQTGNLTSTASYPDEVRAIWISYLEFRTVAQNKSRAQFTQNIDEMFSNISDYGLNTVMVQVRPFGDALYPSEHFPWSYILSGTEGKDPGYDPFGIIVAKAKEYDLRVEAWINPYRVRAIGSSRTLDPSNPAVKAINAGRDTAIAYQSGVFYNPASKAARDLITDGVVELVENYDIAGIHFDDYFYPTTDKAFDASYYSAYTKGGGTLTLGDWRRQNVDLLVKQVYAAIKQADSSATFGISPQARMDNNYNGQFVDIKKWITASGYIDYICPQIYFGFENQTVPYATSLAEWNALTKGTDVQLYIGLAVYKCGAVDQWAGTGINEWVGSTDLLERMVFDARKTSAYAGFALYRYDSLFRPESGVKRVVQQEKDNLSSIL